MLMISLAPCTVLPPVPSGALASTSTSAPARRADSAARDAAPPPPTTSTSVASSSASSPRARRSSMMAMRSVPQGARHDRALDLVRAAEDLEHLGFAVVALHGELHG